MTKHGLLTVIGILTAPFLLGDVPLPYDCEEAIQNEIVQIETRCESNTRTQRISASHREGNGIGYPTGYTSLDGFFSYAGMRNFILFADVRGHFFNNSRKAYNGGLGLRALSESAQAIFGLNAFYDYRDGRHRAFNQIGVGLEILGRRWDVHANGYFPIIKRKKQYEDGFWKFSGNKAVFSKKFEFAFIGCDITFGKELFKMKYWDLHAKLTGYWFNGEYGQNAGGGLFELSTNITPYLTLKGQVSYDTLFREIFQGEAAINIPFGGHFKQKDDALPCKSLKELHSRLAESVDRFEIIVTNTKRKKTVAVDPLTGQTLKFIFVDNTSHSLGTFESPYPTLTQAQNASAPGNVIYVFQGDGTSNGMSSGITLKNNQKLIGSAAPLTVTTPFGLRTIPAQTFNTPVLRNNSGNIVTLASNNQVSGFTMISAASQTAISGSGSVGAEMSYNLFLQSSTETSAVLTGFTGNLNVHQNTFKGAGVGLSFTTAGNATGTVTSNLFACVGGSGSVGACNYTAGVGGTQIFTFDSNQFFPLSSILNSPLSGTNGLVITSTLTTNVTAYITNNSFANFVNQNGMAINVIVTDNAVLKTLVTANTINRTGAAGIQFASSSASTLICDIENNSVSSADLNTANVSGIEILSFFGSGNNIIVRLIGNTSSALNGGFGYDFGSEGNPFSVQSLDGQLTGVEALNTGTFTLTPPVTFIPLFPLF